MVFPWALSNRLFRAPFRRNLSCVRSVLLALSVLSFRELFFVRSFARKGSVLYFADVFSVGPSSWILRLFHAEAFS